MTKFKHKIAYEPSSKEVSRKRAIHLLSRPGSRLVNNWVGGRVYWIPSQVRPGCCDTVFIYHVKG